MQKTATFIVLIVLVVAGVGSYFTTGGLDWYQTLVLPNWIPPTFVFSLVWTVLFVLAGLGVFEFWTKFIPREIRFWFITTLLLSNAVLNMLWSYLFFGQHMLGASTIVAGGLFLVTVIISFLTWSPARRVSVLFMPYACWVLFATYLSYTVWLLN